MHFTTDNPNFEIFKIKEKGFSKCNILRKKILTFRITN